MVVFSRLEKVFPTHRPTFVSIPLKPTLPSRTSKSKMVKFATSNIEDLMICNVDVGWYEKGHVPKPNQY